MAETVVRRVRVTRPLDPGDVAQRAIISELVGRVTALSRAVDGLRSRAWRPVAVALAVQAVMVAASRVGSLPRDLRIILAVIAGGAAAAGGLTLVQAWLRLVTHRRALRRIDEWLPGNRLVGADGLGAPHGDHWQMWTLFAVVVLAAAATMFALFPELGVAPGV